MANTWLDGQGPWWFNAYTWPLNGSAHAPDAWGRYAYSFKEAGDRLTGDILAGKRASLDLLLMPILYLYRHWIELTIKCSLRDLHRHLGQPSSIKTGHTLNGWTAMFDAAGQLAGGAPPTFPEADAFVNELIAMDPGGETFRYPEKINGAPTWSGPDWINIERLASGIEHVQEAIYWVESVLNDVDQANSAP